MNGAPGEPGDITLLLRRWRDGDAEAEEELFRVVLPELRRIAHHFMSRERSGQSIASSDLVNQIYFRLVAARDRDWQDRRHFFRLAARAMRHHLIDRFRGRPDARFIPVEEVQGFISLKGIDLDELLAIDNALNELGEHNPLLSEIVEMKCFLNLTDQEAADALGMKLRTVQAKWHDARVWLFERLKGDYARS